MACLALMFFDSFGEADPFADWAFDEWSRWEISSEFQGRIKVMLGSGVIGVGVGGGQFVSQSLAGCLVCDALICG